MNIENMDWSWVFLIAIALSMDAFAVSITCGIKLREIILRKYLKISIAFGLFQAIMPIIGWFAGNSIKSELEYLSKWITFFIFIVLGVKTIYETFFSKSSKNCTQCKCENEKCLLSLAIATSIDALVIGVLFAINGVPLLLSVLVIGLVTFSISFGGCFIGNKVGIIFGKIATSIAALILFLLAVKTII